MGSFIEVLLTYMDPIAAIIAVGITHLIRYFLPTPEGGKKFDVNDRIYRFLPILPVFLAVLVVFFRSVWIEQTPLPIDEAICKGLVSGFAAAYFYRTVKILLFGKGGFEKGKDEYNRMRGNIEEYKRYKYQRHYDNGEEDLR